ncbi:MAG: hypothetical protein P0Y53_02440 [Candidatus Pseudobacter hemicellulosilyticus]|uniref:Uncharacterized protein n=1 Tax=Candidatus Pseudobacter hemicellulosilyticus TaxID=3121375 RepID=A0AAJ5WVF4_9BACT|nr:MAG: hypothetical protein P0Y53_02440 [Pseudobacter sp.]
MKKINQSFYYLILPLLVISSCKKFNDKLAEKEKESGILFIQQKGATINQAKTDEEITVLAKIGEEPKVLHFYMGDVEITPLSSKESEYPVEDVFTDQLVNVPVVEYRFIIPKNVKIGPNNVYFTINGKVRPPISLEVRKPDILFPGKVTISTFAKSILTTLPDGSTTVPRRPIDGPLGQAGIASVDHLAYDQNTRSFYFVDWYYEDTLNPNQSPAYYLIRKLQDNQVTTIAGGGKNIETTNGLDKKFTRILCMAPGIDGQLYISLIESVPLNPGGSMEVDRCQIVKLDPQTGKLTPFAGAKIRNGNMLTGYRDGKDSALLTNVPTMTFDKNGNLYFIDDLALLRKAAPDGTVTTLLGQYDSFSYETADGETGEPLMETIYWNIPGHTDGFEKEVMFQNASKMAIAGNGKLYIMEQFTGDWQTNIREVNLDTREVSTIIGLPTGVRTYMNTGTFRDVELGDILSFDLDYDGNLIFTAIPIYKIKPEIYKMDLQSETIALLAGNNGLYCNPDQDRPIAGPEACLSNVTRIVFDQFGTLYVGNMSVLRIRKITIE